MSHRAQTARIKVSRRAKPASHPRVVLGCQGRPGCILFHRKSLNGKA
jgi:hypothetical protein